MKGQVWLVSLVSVLGGLAMGYGVSSDQGSSPSAQAPNVEKHLISLEEKIEKIEVTLNAFQLRAADTALMPAQAPVERTASSPTLTQKDIKEAVKGAIQEQGSLVEPTPSTNNSASAPISNTEQIAVDTLIQNIGAQNQDSRSVIGSENMQALSLAAQNQVMAEITRRLNSGELKPEEFFGPEYPMH